MRHALVIEEKIDGANLGISIDSHGALRFQNRGNWLDGNLTAQWSRLRGWAAEHESLLREHLPQGHVLFGEWCYARHSIEYDHLPDWFLSFDIYDPHTKRFWCSDRRDMLLRLMEIHPVPTVARGRFGIPDLTKMLDSPSAFSSAPIEGIYLRQEDNGWLVARAKLVRSEFTQQIAEHWSKRAIQPNRLAQAPQPHST